jgi:PAS domain S-box-containing protein
MHVAHRRMEESQKDVLEQKKFLVREVQARIEMEDVLAESEQRFRQLAENIDEVFWMSNLQVTEVLYVSPAYERVWGRSCQSLYEQPRSFLDAVHSDDLERVLIDVTEKQSRGEPTDKKYRVVRPDGSVSWVRDRAFPVRDAAGRVYRMAGIAEDITEKKQAEEAMKEADSPLSAPRVGLDKGGAATPVNGDERHGGSKRRILVVDDNRDSADSLAMMLQLMGHDTMMAHDGLEAVQAAETYRPDVVLLDIGLPQMNGYEAARCIREQQWGKSMLIIALTGWGQDEDKRRALEAGFDHHLIKPVGAEVLEDVLIQSEPYLAGPRPTGVASGE